jgi:hypothetical protein
MLYYVHKYIKLYLQWDPYPFLFGSPARLARFHPRTCQPTVALTVGKDPPREPILLDDTHTIGCFGLPSDSSTSAYAPSENPLSPLNLDYHSAHMPQSEMSEDHPFPMATKNLLQMILERLGPTPGLLNESRPSPTRWLQSCPPTPIPTLGSGRKKTLLKPSAPSEFDGDHAEGKAFLTSCQTYIRLCPEAFEDDTIKIVWAMSYMKSRRAGCWAAREFEYNAISRDKRLRFLDWVNFEDEFHKDFLPLNGEATAVNMLETSTYFQGKRMVNDYIDHFQDLVYDSRYTDPKTIMVKFH